MARKRSLLTWAAATAGLLAGGGVMLQMTGCISPLLTNAAASATDFCFIFDCQNGLFSGTIDPCAPTFGPMLTDQGPFLADCP